MYNDTIEETLEALRNTSKKASESKEFAIQLLFDIGVIKEKEYKQKLKLYKKERLNQGDK
jgi:hypothetical protein